MSFRTDDLPSVARRLEAGRMLLDGATVKDVADALRLSAATVKRYRAVLEEGGLDALKQMSVGGRTSALDNDALRWIASAIDGPASEHGFPGEEWTNARVRELIAKRYGITYSRVYTWQIVTNLGLGHRLSRSHR